MDDPSLIDDTRDEPGSLCSSANAAEAASISASIGPL